jgi:hypothetical protein
MTLTPREVELVLKEREEGIRIITENMLCNGDDGIEVLMPRTNTDNDVGLAYADAIRARPLPDVISGGWVKRSERLPRVGGTYLVGAYDDTMNLPRTFVRFWASLFLFETGPEWQIRDAEHEHRTVEYWIDLPPHPEHVIRSRPQPSAPTGQAEPVASKDTARLDFLDRLNASLNKRYNTNYRWELIFNHNVTRLMLGGHLVVDLNDTKHNGAHSCRDAIDAKMREHGVNIASPTPPDGYRVGDE